MQKKKLFSYKKNSFPLLSIMKTNYISAINSWIEIQKKLTYTKRSLII